MKEIVGIVTCYGTKYKSKMKNKLIVTTLLIIVRNFMILFKFLEISAFFVVAFCL